VFSNFVAEVSRSSKKWSTKPDPPANL